MGNTQSAVAPSRCSPTGQMLGKLLENRSTNMASGTAGDSVGMTEVAHCHRCGLSESVLFWTPVKRRKHSIKLRCPSGCRTRLRYDFRTRKVTRAPEWIGATSAFSLIALTAVITVAYTTLPGTDQATGAQPGGAATVVSEAPSMSRMKPAGSPTTIDPVGHVIGAFNRVSTFLAVQAAGIEKLLIDLADTPSQSGGGEIGRSSVGNSEVFSA